MKPPRSDTGDIKFIQLKEPPSCTSWHKRYFNRLDFVTRLNEWVNKSRKNLLCDEYKCEAMAIKLKVVRLSTSKGPATRMLDLPRLSSNAPIDLSLEVKERVWDKPLTGEIMLKSELRMSLTFWKAGRCSSPPLKGIFTWVTCKATRGA